MKKILFFIFISLLSFQAFSQKKQWKKAQTRDSIEEYKKFLAKYPDSSPYTLYAKEQLVLLEAANALQENDLNYFIQNYSSPEYEEVAFDWLINFELMRVLELADTLEYDRYQAKYPQTGHSIIVQLQRYSEIRLKSLFNQKSMEELSDSVELIICNTKNKLETAKGLKLLEFYNALGRAYSLLATIQGDLQEDSPLESLNYKLAGDNFYLGSKLGLSLGLGVVAKVWMAASDAPAPYFNSKRSLAPVLVKTKTDQLYSSSVNAYRKAGYNDHANWMVEGKEMRLFEVNEIKK